MAFMLENRTRRLSGCGARLLRWRVEVQSPFYDLDLMARISQLPHEWRIRDRFYVALSQRVAPAAAHARWARSGIPVSWPYWLAWLSIGAQHVAKRVCRRTGMPPPFPRQEFHDFAAWFRGPLQRLVRSVLLDDRALERGLVAPDTIRAVVEEHALGLRDHSDLIGVLLSLEVFCRDFLDEFQTAFEWSRSVLRVGPGRDSIRARESAPPDD
jgi:hypothetical protein